MAKHPAARLIRLLLVCPLLWCAPRLPAADRDANRLGVEMSWASRPFGSDEPRSGALGGGIFYERLHLVEALPLLLGARVGGYGLYALDQTADDSALLQAGIYLGCDFPLPVERRFSLSLAPYLGFIQGWSLTRVGGRTVVDGRPALGGGLVLYLHVDRRALFAVVLEAGLALDGTPRGTFLQGERLGVRF